MRVASLSRHAEVLAALNDSRLGPPGSAGGDPAAHLAVRSAITLALPPARLAEWREAFAAQAHALIDALPEDGPVDLVAALAEPWSFEVALLATGLPRELAAVCEPLARQVYGAAALATDGHTPPESLEAALALARQLATAAARAGGLADVQTFVALTQSLPALLAGAWWVLLRHPAALARLLATPELEPRVLNELLRLGSPAQAVFREAREDLVIGAVRLQRGDRLALMLALANRDEERFPDPERFDPMRDAHGALGLGAGPHHCAGMALVRLALAVATQALLARCTQLQLADPASAEPAGLAWRGGFAMRAPAALQVLRQPRGMVHVTKGI